ncbi:MAG TPA: hypothetical protein VHZ55_20845 [Bryobacteraceae bacterium]|nr:hypothetical protein [Bryobacteraceae bacterium]
MERLIGSIRRECLDHIIVFGERSMHRALASLAHSFVTRQRRPAIPTNTSLRRGKVVDIREIGGLLTITHAALLKGIDYTSAQD